MSCGPRAEVTAGTASSTRWWSPRTWTLRARLVVTQVALLAVVCASIGVATEFALQRLLMNQLDDQLIEAGRRSAAIFELPPPPPGTPPPPGLHRHHRFPFDPEDGPGPGFLNAPGQAART
ncbi:two-component sensor histidine kinase, partial [Mycolicibacterium fortuitum]